MKINGIESLHYRRPFVFESIRKPDGSPLSITLSALPYYWDRDVVRELGGRPSAPIRKVGESDGKPIWKTCEDDAAFVAATSEFDAMFLTAMVFLSIADDVSITWDTPKELRKTDPKAYWRSIAEEIRASGWPAIEVKRLIEECQKLSESVPEVPKSDFLSTGS